MVAVVTGNMAAVESSRQLYQVPVVKAIILPGSVVISQPDSGCGQSQADQLVGAPGGGGAQQRGFNDPPCNMS